MKIPNAQLALALAVLSWPKANVRDQTGRAQGYLQWLEEQEQQLFKEPLKKDYGSDFWDREHGHGTQD